LVLIACGAVLLSQLGFVSAAMVPLAFGAIISVMVYTLGHISGAHFNPAVTIAFCVARHFPMRKVFGYILAQCFGALSASYLHLKLFPSGHDFGMTHFVLGIWPSFGIEFTLTFLLMFVIMSVATDTRAIGEMAGIAIGTTVALAALVGGSLTGASLNPARSIGPAILAQDFSGLWLYLVAPLCGAIAGAVVYKSIQCKKETGSGPAGCC